MPDLLLIAIAAATVNNIVLERLLGLRPVLGETARSDSRIADAVAMGLVTTCALALTAGLSHLLNESLLVPLGLGYLRIIALLAVSTLAVQAVSLLLRRSGAAGPALCNESAPRITMNCIVLGVALLTTGTAKHLTDAIALGAGAGIGFTAVVTLFASLRRRLELFVVPQPLRGLAISLVTVGIMSLGFRGFSGIGT